LHVLVTLAGRRWSVKESFQAGKGLAGPDEHQHRRWQPWRRWTIFAMLAHALLAVTTAEQASIPPPDSLIALSCNENRRLLVVHVIAPTRRIACRTPGQPGDAGTNTAQNQPLPAPTSITTIYGWSTRPILRLRVGELGRWGSPMRGMRWGG